LHQSHFAVFKIDLEDPERRMQLVLHDPNGDIDGGLIRSRATREVVGIRHPGPDGRIEFWAESFQQLQDAVDRALAETTNVLVDFSSDEQRYVVYAYDDVNPGKYYFGNRDTGTLHPFGETYPELAEYELAGKSPVAYDARDGLRIEGYLTPPWGNPPKPWPAVILPHGGPMARDYETFDYWSEFLASRGYAVLQMNFRGSSGYGWDFMSAAYKNFGGQMQDDIEDGTRWAVGKGIFDRERICIMGGSYGGYAALWAAVKTPTLFQCAISVNGVSDWSMMLNRAQHYIQEEIIEEMLGKKSDLKEVSPLKRASEIRVPILILHGEMDRVVPVKQSRRMAKALEKLEKEYRYIELDNGDHNLSDYRDRTATLTAIESFLARHLDDRAGAD
jgi:dipeptidyl aminopeptidase/acylaminoacyl peptidase